MNPTPTRHRQFLLRLLSLGLALGLLSGTGFAQQQIEGKPQTNLPRVRLTAGMVAIDAQVALTPDQRQTGLMYRRDMPTNEGMLFIFEQASPQCFWMKNTLIPLTAAFVDDDGTIVNMADMKPQTTDSHCSDKPVRFVLEMNKDWFKQRNIKPGFKLGGTPFAQRR